MNLNLLKYNISAAIALFLLLNGAEELKKQGYLGEGTNQTINTEKKLEDHHSNKSEFYETNGERESVKESSREKSAKRSIASENSEKKEHSLNIKEILSSLSTKVKNSFMKALDKKKEGKSIKKDKKEKEESLFAGFSYIKDKKEREDESEDNSPEKENNEKNEAKSDSNSMNPASSLGLAPVPELPKNSSEETVNPEIDLTPVPQAKLVINNMTLDIFKNEEKTFLFNYNQDQVLALECSVGELIHLTQVQPCSCVNGSCSMVVKASPNYVGEENLFLTLKTAEDTRTKVVKINILPFNIPPEIELPETLSFLSNETKNLDIRISDVETALDCSQITTGTTSFQITMSGSIPNCVANINYNGNLDLTEVVDFSISDGEKISTDSVSLSSIRLIELSHNLNKDFYPKDFKIPLVITAKYSNGEERNSWDFVSITNTNSSLNSQILNMNQLGSGNIEISYKDISVDKSFEIFDVLGMNLSEYKITAPLNSFLNLTAWLTLTNGERFDITEFANWNKDCSKINLNKGKVEAIEGGNCSISVGWESYSHNLSMTILNNGFDSIEIRGLAYLNIFSQEKFKAVGIILGQEIDITQHGTWLGDAKMMNLGNSYIAMEDGNAQVKFQYGTEEISKTIEIGCASLIDINIVLEKNILSSFEQVQLKANGIFDDGRTIDVSESVEWTVNSVVPLIQNNVFYANNTTDHMNYVVTVSKNSLSRNRNIFFSPSNISQISSNFNGNISIDSKFNLKVYLNNQDGSVVDISKESLVYSLNNSIVNISSNLEIYGKALGTVSLRVKYGLNTVDIPVTVGIPSQEKGSGLLAKYYSGINFNTYRGERVEWKLNYDYMTSIKNPVGTIDLFSIKWTGFFRAPSSGNFVFCTDSDDGVRFKFNNNWVINVWTHHDPRRDCSLAINLVQGQKYPIELDYYQNTGSSVIRLLYGPNSTSQTVIPQELLFVD